MEVTWSFCLFLWLAGLSMMVYGAVEWKEHTGRCYHLSQSSLNYSTAEVTCKNMAANVQLAEMDSPGELLAVNQIIESGSSQYWVATVKPAASTYVWKTSGTSPEAWMWATNEPNDSGACVRLMRYYIADLGMFYLGDHYCSYTYQPLCEKPSSETSAYGQRLFSLPSKLCEVASFVTSGLQACAAFCARSTSCFVYGYKKTTGACSFHRLLNQCSNGTTATSFTPDVKYFQITRACE